MKKFDGSKIKEWLQGLREKWNALARTTRVFISAAVILVLAVALVGTFVLNAARQSYRQIFPGMTSSEAVEVYSVLQQMGASPQIDGGQRVTVPADQWDALVFELNSRGYPKTTLSYDVFTNASGFTATEFEKRTALVYQAQERMQATLLRQDGVSDAVVTFSVAETSNYIWDQNNQAKSTANISVRMMPGRELTAQRVTAIKHLAATSVPKLDPEDVVVVDAATGVELLGTGQENDAETRERLLELEEYIAKIYEDKVRRLLTPTYGADGVTAVATVALDYDKIVTETKQFQPLEGGDGGGVRSHYEEAYTRSGSDTVGGLVGEENNDDVPQYPFDDGTGDGSMLDYSKLIDYDNSYVLTQMEKGQAIRAASIAVIVNDPQFTAEKEDTLVSLISKSVNISAENVVVTNLLVGEEQPTQPVISNGLTQRQILLLLIGAGILLLLILILVIILSLRGKKKKKVEAEQKAQEEAAEQQRLEMERAVAEHKKRLQDEALAAHKPEENAIVDEVREFAEANPEITASLIRSMMREEK